MSNETTQDKSQRSRPRSFRVWVVVATLLAAGVVVAILTLVWSRPVLLGDGRASGWPTESWATSTPKEQDMDAGQLEAMRAYIDEHDMEVDAIVVVRHGRIVFEEYRNGYSQRATHRLYSVTKSVTSMLVGIAIHAGLIEGLDVPLTELLPEHTIANLDARKERLTLEHLLAMSDGMDWNEHDYPYADPKNPVNQMWASSDAVQHVLDRPMAREPGEAWAYNSGASVLLGEILEEATGRDLPEFAREVLFDPIGIGQVRWTKAAGGHYDTGGGSLMTPRDMARLGYLMLHQGTWDGREILPADWIARSTTAYNQAIGYYGYGYQWWVLPNGLGYAALGMDGQRIFVLPEADMVIVTAANQPDGAIHSIDGLVHGFILPACNDLAAEPRRETFDGYGFTFEYPGSFLLSVQPIPGSNTLSDASGMVQITSNSAPVEAVSVLWYEAEPGAEARAFLESYLTSLAEIGAEMVPGASHEGRKDGHPLALRISKLTLDGGTLPAVAGAWICGESGRAFAMTYMTAAEATPEDLQASFERYLEGLACH